MDLLENIKLLIAQNCKSTNAFLADVGLSHNYIKNLEKGQSPTADKLIIIAKYFGVTTDYLLGLSDEPSSKMQTIFNQLSPEEQEKAIQSLYEQFPKLYR